MQYRKWPLGYLSAQAVIQVVLRGSESDVFLADDANLRRFERGEDFRYVPSRSQVAAA